MGRQSQNQYIKRQKESERIRKAKAKMARRQGKKDETAETGTTEISDQPLAAPQADGHNDPIVQPPAHGSAQTRDSD